MAKNSFPDHKQKIITLYLAFLQLDMMWNWYGQDFVKKIISIPTMHHSVAKINFDLYQLSSKMHFPKFSLSIFPRYIPTNDLKINFLQRGSPCGQLLSFSRWNIFFIFYHVTIKIILHDYLPLHHKLWSLTNIDKSLLTI